MKKYLLAIVMVVTLLLATTGAVLADNPDSGDCIPNEGSNELAPNGPNGNNAGTGSGHMEAAPNSGDGIPDGPGW